MPNNRKERKMKYMVKLYDRYDRELFFVYTPNIIARGVEKVDKYMDCKTFAFAVGMLTLTFVILPVLF
jgi:sulfur relay (sulfurtransferase) DsrF/TusC family protein